MNIKIDKVIQVVRMGIFHFGISRSFLYTYYELIFLYSFKHSYIASFQMFRFLRENHRFIVVFCLLVPNGTKTIFNLNKNNTIVHTVY